MAPKRRVVSVKKKVVKESTVEVAMWETNNSQTLTQNEDELLNEFTTTTTTTTKKAHEVERNEDAAKKTPIPVEDKSSLGRETEPKQKPRALFDQEEVPREANLTPTSSNEDVKEQDEEKSKAKTETETKARATSKGKKKKKGSRETYKIYVFKVLKQVHPGMGITAKTMTIIDNMMNDMFERLAGEASNLSTHTKKSTITAREIQAAVSLVLPGDLGRHAVAEGTKAVSNYFSYPKS